MVPAASRFVVFSHMFDLFRRPVQFSKHVFIMLQWNSQKFIVSWCDCVQWDRQVWEWLDDTGNRTVIKKYDEIVGNFFIGNYCSSP